MRDFGLTPVINVAGTMTALGASLVRPEAIEAAAAIQSEFLLIDELQARASDVIARATGAEAGVVTACSAAAMTLAIAGAMTGPDLAKVEQLPDSSGMKDEVVIPAGHLINYGAPIEQAVRLAGAKVVALGSVAGCTDHHLQQALSENTVAALFVVSHHVEQRGALELEAFIATCRAHGVPVIVDMASEYDLRGPLAMGASLAIYSAHKFLGGPTAGLLAGDKALVQAAYLQNHGIGRQMKVGKEGIVGALAALRAWGERDHQAVRAREEAVVAGWMSALAATPGLTPERHADWTGNPIERVKITVDPKVAGLFAWELAARLLAGRPAIAVRDDLLEQGLVFLDPCNLRPGKGEEAIVAQRIDEEVRAALERADGGKLSLADWRRARLEHSLAWPASFR